MVWLGNYSRGTKCCKGVKCPGLLPQSLGVVWERVVPPTGSVFLVGYKGQAGISFPVVSETVWCREGYRFTYFSNLVTRMKLL